MLTVFILLPSCSSLELRGLLFWPKILSKKCMVNYSPSISVTSPVLGTCLHHFRCGRHSSIPAGLCKSSDLVYLVWAGQGRPDQTNKRATHISAHRMKYYFPEVVKSIPNVFKKSEVAGQRHLLLALHNLFILLSSLSRFYRFLNYLKFLKNPLKKIW